MALLLASDRLSMLQARFPSDRPSGMVAYSYPGYGHTIGNYKLLKDHQLGTDKMRIVNFIFGVYKPFAKGTVQ